MALLTDWRRGEARRRRREGNRRNCPVANVFITSELASSSLSHLRKVPNLIIRLASLPYYSDCSWADSVRWVLPETCCTSKARRSLGSRLVGSRLVPRHIG
ncbi:hypothetical protein IF1G_02978 [Cordyceps javanica]|uniref:Uncharacterized protein n=1 Tax=Cordyceps javanica TaxID=43265 RepID=A0A545VB21_9HYPO|nr:hypothetical protein IF1G_02978 [Cordyceps javanica]